MEDSVANVLKSRQTVSTSLHSSTKPVNSPYIVMVLVRVF